MSDVATLNGNRVPMQMLRTYVFTLWRSCFAYRVDPSHVCFGTFGQRHSPYDHSMLTLEHVTQVHSVSEGRKTDERHTVPLCAALNGVSIAPASLRRQMRRDLLLRFPTCLAPSEDPGQDGDRPPASKETA